MGYLRRSSIFLVILFSAYIIMGPVSFLYPADGMAAPAEAPASGDADKADEDADKAEPRKLPQLQPGEWEPLFEMGESIYPSAIISTATLKGGLWDDTDKEHLGDPWGIIGIAVRGTGNNCPITVEISGGSFIGPSTFTGTLSDKDKVYCVYPELKYDYEKLLAVKQTIPEILSFKTSIGAKAHAEKTVRVQVRPVNECVYNFADSSGNINDVSYFFAAYVNENHPFINSIMKDAIAAKMVGSFAGYQGDRDDVMAEIEAIWNTLKDRGMHYSTMPASADDDNPYISSQYVRLLGESIDYSQANCVDGSVLMASIFRKIGLDTSLVEMPEHMFVAVNLDSEGKETVFIETTELADSSLDEAIQSGNEKFEENKDKFDSQKPEDEGYNIINIQAARDNGIMPIKDSSVN